MEPHVHAFEEWALVLPYPSIALSYTIVWLKLWLPCLNEFTGNTFVVIKVDGNPISSLSSFSNCSYVCSFLTPLIASVVMAVQKQTKGSTSSQKPNWGWICIIPVFCTLDLNIQPVITSKNKSTRGKNLQISSRELYSEVVCHIYFRYQYVASYSEYLYCNIASGNYFSVISLILVKWTQSLIVSYWACLITSTLCPRVLQAPYHSLTSSYDVALPSPFSHTAFPFIDIFC